MLESPSEIVCRARGKMKQKPFSELIGKSQTTICKYEKGKVEPPLEVLEKCYEIINKNSLDELKIKMEALSHSSHVKFRYTVLRLIDQYLNAAEK